MQVLEKLKVVRDFQIKYPDAHIGGSIGLLIHGINLKRDLLKSDIDLTVSKDLDENIPVQYIDASSNNNDFDYNFRVESLDNSCYVKIDVRVNPEPSFVIMVYEGFSYNVSKLTDIIFWKQKYAKKGFKKHINDLIVINGGERPAETVQEYSDDLPF